MLVWHPPSDQRGFYVSAFDQARDESLVVSATDAILFLSTCGLSKQQIKAIWVLASGGATDVNFEGFCAVLRLVRHELLPHPASAIVLATYTPHSQP